MDISNFGYRKCLGRGGAIQREGKKYEETYRPKNNFNNRTRNDFSGSNIYFDYGLSYYGGCNGEIPDELPYSRII